MTARSPGGGSLEPAGASTAIDAIRSAGYRAEMWQSVIDLLAEATGSQLGELVGWFSPARRPFRLMTWDRSDRDERLDVWNAIGGADPRINPMVRAGMRARPLQTLVDTDLIGVDARRRNILWNEVFDPCDIPHLGSVLLHRDGDTHLVIGVLRSRAQGPLVGEARRVFEDCAREAQAAAAFARLLGDDSGQLLAGALEAVDAAAVAVNRFGMVVGITPAAERLISDGRCLRLAQRRLWCRDAGEQARLVRALEGVLDGGHSETLAVQAPGQLLGVTIFPLRAPLDLGYNARAILVLEDRSAGLALTPAEEAVLALLRQGLNAAAIADRRGVSRETARSQIKSVYAKLGVRRQVELLRRA